jgi:hypothetical protein
MHTSILVADEGDIYDLLDRFANYDGESDKPEAKFDYFGVGGRFADTLPLKEPRPLRRLFGLLPAGHTTRATTARKSEIDEPALLVDPPAALFFRNQLHECPLSTDPAQLTSWQAHFRTLFARIPADAVLRMVDAHS